MEAVALELGLVGETSINGIVDSRGRAVVVEARIRYGEHRSAFKSRDELLNLLSDDRDMEWSAILGELKLPKALVVNHMVLSKVIPWGGGAGNDGL